MKVERIESDLLQSNMYIVIEGNKAIIIDPCRKFALAPGVTPEFIFLTHEHYDHISGVNDWKSKYCIPVLCSDACDQRIRNPRKNMARYFEAFCMLQTDLKGELPEDYDPDYTCYAEKVFSEDFEFRWEGHKVVTMKLPGHSPGSSGLLIDDCLFAGDCVFRDKDTVLHFPDGSEKNWREITLDKIRSLSPTTMVFPGHFDRFELRQWKEYRKA